MYDDRTKYLDLPLPHPDNTIDQDVPRLRESLKGLDSAAAAHAADISALAAAKAGKYRIPDPDNPDGEIAVDPQYNYERHEADLVETNDRIASLIGAIAYIPAHDFGNPADYPDEGAFQDALTAKAVAYFPAWERAGLPNALVVQNLWNGHEWVYSADLTYWTDNGPGGTAAFTQQLAGVIRGRDAFGYVKAEIGGADNSTVGKVAGLESAGEGKRLLGDDGKYHSLLPEVYNPNVVYRKGDVYVNPADPTDWRRLECDDAGAPYYTQFDLPLATADAGGLFEEPPGAHNIVFFNTIYNPVKFP